MIEEYEKSGLPTKEEFKNIQERFCILEMGIQDDTLKTNLPKIDEAKSSIDLYNDYIFNLDESPQVNKFMVFKVQH